MNDKPDILSLNELKIHLPQDVHNQLETQYAILNDTSSKHIDKILKSMKTSPADTCCRVNLLTSSVDEVIKELKVHLSTIDGDFNAHRHETISDLVIIRANNKLSKTDIDGSDINELYNCSIPPNKECIDLFPNWSKRKELGWPMSHRSIVVDRYCGEAVLRGSHIFVKGILAADSGIVEQEEVAIYAHLSSKSIPRGLVLEKYSGKCVFLGLGTSNCKRSDCFAQSSGIGVTVTKIAGLPQPSLNSILTTKMMMQNLPSVCVAHALDPQPGDVILDMCAAPGGKTTHLASLMGNEGLIIACDKSKKKMVTTRDFFQSQGASCIVPLALDSTKALLELPEGQCWMSPKDIIETASTTGLLEVGFYANSFDRILLDPPCSALGLRPKLHVELTSKELSKMADYQKRFVNNAVHLLKPGGTMTYSTCTINACENEDMVKYILETFPCMKLVPIQSEIPGLNGLSNRGLSREECQLVRRFDPSGELDTMGFFLAKFIKSS